MKRSILSSLAVSALAIAGGAVQAAEVAGTEVQLGWDPADGPVAGYYVIVSRNDAASEIVGMTAEPSAAVGGEPGDTVVVQVAAFDDQGQAGPLSSPSESITFVSEVDSSSSTTTEETTEESGSTSGSGSEETTEETAPVSEESGDALVIAPTDFDCDGASDLLVLEPGAAPMIWAMDGARVAREIPLPAPPTGSVPVSAGDYDGDGCAELLWLHASTGDLEFWRLDAGTFVEAVPLATLPPEEGWQVVGSRDSNGDGHDDLHVHSPALKESATALLFDGRIVEHFSGSPGRGQWEVRGLLDAFGGGFAESLWRDSKRGHLHRFDPISGNDRRITGMSWDGDVLASADLDGDGADELLLRGPDSGDVAWVRLKEPQGVETGALLPNPRPRGRFVAKGDYDGDGRDDLAWSDPASGAVTLWLEGASVVRRVDLLLPESANLAAFPTQ